MTQSESSNEDQLIVGPLVEEEMERDGETEIHLSVLRVYSGLVKPEVTREPPKKKGEEPQWRTIVPPAPPPSILC